MIFGDKIKELRKEKGLSQKELGDILALGQTTIANYEKNIRFPNPKTLVEIADYFDCSLDELVGRFNEELSPFTQKEIKSLKETIQTALLDEDEEAVKRVIYEIKLDDKRLIQLYEGVITKILVHTGNLWEQGIISVAKEHYISGILADIISGFKKDLAEMNDRLPSEKLPKKVICLSLSSEPHTLGIRMIRDYFEILGYRTFYLGANIPTDALKDMIIKNQVNIIALSATMDYHLDSLKNLIYILQNDSDIKVHLKDSLEIVVGGQAIRDKSHGSILGADLYATDFNSLKEGLIM